MVTKNDIITRFTSDGITDWSQYRAYTKAARANVEKLEEIQRADCINQKTPIETISAFVSAVGYDAAVATVATLINRCAWDDRISINNKKWAATIDEAMNEDAAAECLIYTTMHMAHLDQIASATRDMNEK